MESNASKWLLGCGIGCGVLILILVIIAGFGFLCVKSTVEQFKDVEASLDTLEAVYGTAEEFCPQADGYIKPERIEIFLAVRDSTAPVRKELEETFGAISQGIDDGRDKKKSFWGVLGLVRKGMRLIPKIAEYYETRNRALMNYGMGQGEYYYIYVIAYYSWLKKSPGDGPKFRLMGNQNVYINYEKENKERKKEELSEIIKERESMMRRRANKMLLSMLRNQLEKLKEYQSLRSRSSWMRRLENEISALESDEERIPWQTGVPNEIEISLTPYRERLEASYNAMVNPIELGPENK